MSTRKLPVLADAMLDLFKVFHVHNDGSHPVVNHKHAAKLIDTLSQVELEECLFLAATMGNVRLMNALWEQRGPIQVDYVNEAGTKDEFLNGKPFISRRSQIFRNAPTSVELKQLLETIKAYGMKGLIEPGATSPFIFRKHDFVNAVLVARDVRFKGELPFLDAGVVNSPELALSLTGESARSATPNAYQPMLCWATEAMITEFGSHLVPMRPMQRVAYQGVLQAASQWGGEMRCTVNATMAEFKAGPGKDGDGPIFHLTMGVEPDLELSILAGSLLHYMGNLASEFGFADPQGRVLCETRADFLMQFPSGACSEQNLTVSEDFVARYCPVDIISNQIRPYDDSMSASDLGGIFKEHKRATLTLPLYRTIDNDNFSLVFDLLSRQSPIRERTLDMMTHEHWKMLVQSSSSKEFDAVTLISIRDALGLDNQGMAITLRLDALDKLHAAGYRFTEETLVVAVQDDMYRHKKLNPQATLVSLHIGYGSVMDLISEDSASKVLAESIRLHRLCQAMNLWVSPLPKPTSLERALDEMSYRTLSADDTQGLVLSAYLFGQGIDACAKAASLATHWLTITQTFPPEEVMPYLPTMPALVKGKFLESEMGL
jgi:hypothetical protein